MSVNLVSVSLISVVLSGGALATMSHSGASGDFEANNSYKQYYSEGYRYCNASSNPYGETHYISNIFYARVMSNELENAYFAYIAANYGNQFSVICQGPFNSQEDALAQANDQIWRTQSMGNSVYNTYWTY